jgi:apolipoprotein N-acyltransferase
VSSHATRNVPTELAQRRLVTAVVVALTVLVAKPGQTLPATLAAVALILGTLVLIRVGKAGRTTLVALVGIGVVGTAIFVWVAIRSHDAVVVGGSLVFLVTMYAGY